MNRSSPFRRAKIIGLITLLLAAPSVATAGVVFRKIYDVKQRLPGVTLAADQFLAMPGGTENAPAYDGRFVALPILVDGVSANASHLWTYDTVTGSLKRLISDSDVFPDTDGKLVGYKTIGGGFAPFSVDQGRVVFRARATASTGAVAGFLTRLAAGPGTPVVLVDSNTASPDAQGFVGNFSLFTFANNVLIAQDNGKLAFSQDKDVGDGGSYLVPNTGGTVKEIADEVFLGRIFPPQCCEVGDYQNDRIVSRTSNVFGTGPIVTLKDNGSELQIIVSTERGDRVPNDPEDRVFDAFRLLLPQIENRNVVFQGAAIPHVTGSLRDLAGLYSFVSKDSLVRPDPDDGYPPYAPGKIIRLVDSNMAVPGGTGKFTRDDPLLATLAGGGFSFSGTSVFFLGRDEAQKTGLYHVRVNGGPIRKIVANGDILPDGRKVGDLTGALAIQPPIQPDSAHNDEIAVKLSVSNRAPGNAEFDAIYLFGADGLPASPVLCNDLKATIIGTSGDDRIFGTTGKDVIVGMAGNDTINGLAGDDVICGGPGNDTLDGGTGGNDLLIGNAGTDACANGETSIACEGKP